MRNKQRVINPGNLRYYNSLSPRSAMQYVAVVFQNIHHLQRRNYVELFHLK